MKRHVNICGAARCAAPSDIFLVGSGDARMKVLRLSEIHHPVWARRTPDIVNEDGINSRPPESDCGTMESRLRKATIAEHDTAWFWFGRNDSEQVIHETKVV